MGPSSVSNFRIWNEGILIVRDCYALTTHWPKSELFGLTGQTRRAAVSRPCNLAEGRGRGNKGRDGAIAQIALGSLYELDTLLQIAAELKIADPTAIRPVRERLSLLARQISSFIQKSRSAA